MLQGGGINPEVRCQERRSAEVAKNARFFEVLVGEGELWRSLAKLGDTENGPARHPWPGTLAGDGQRYIRKRTVAEEPGGHRYARLLPVGKVGGGTNASTCNF